MNNCKTCGTPLTPNPRQRNNSRFPHEFCCTRCRIKYWEKQHPRVGVGMGGSIKTKEKK